MIATVEVVRRQPMVTCPHCQASIPHHVRQPCPECGNVPGHTRAPRPPEDARIIDGDAKLVDEDGLVVGVQIVSGVSIANRLGQALSRDVTWERGGNEGRLSGISVVHRTFGFAPPVPLRRRHACTRCRFDFEYPDVAELLGEMSNAMAQTFRAHAPDAYAFTQSEVDAVIPAAWRVAETPWTSGIINHTAALPYHRDSGNIARSWSAMLTCRRGVSGGALHLVDYDVWLACPNGAVAIFDGQSVLHGVSPLHRDRPDGYRFTLVTYARKGMKVCAPDPADEPRRAQRAATESQDRQLHELRQRRGL